MPIEITLFPNNQGGIRYLMQDADTRRVLKQGELLGEADLSESRVAETFPELPPGDHTTLLDLMTRVVKSRYPEKYVPAAGKP